MKGFLTLLTVIGIITSGFAQDEKAKGILDKLSAKTKSYSTIKAEFQLTLINKSEGLNETQSGSIYLKGEKYFISIQGQDIICDGKSMWTHIKESEEVQINDLPDEDEEEYISPSKIFTLYEDGFKYKFLKDENGIQIINLYPKASDDKSFHRIALFINKAKNQISKVKVYGKDGTTFIYKIKTFSPNVSISDTKFKFDKAKHPGVEVIDLRD